jgi:SAM-dependent methyltransferase
MVTLRQIGRAARSPARLKREILSRLRTVPFRLGVTSLWPGTHLAYVPDRYSDNYDRYRNAGGAMTYADRRAFLQGHRANNAGDLARFHFLSLVCDQIVKEGIAGDIAELGVYKGNTAALLARLARRLNRTAYLLDTFSGFSEADATGVDRGARAQFSDTSLDAVRARVGDANVRYLAGHFPATAAEIPDGARFCLVHLDCDLYAPFAAALRYFYPRLAPGGFLIMHDYASLYWEGAEKAVDEFFADKPERPVPIPDKSGTAVIRKVGGAR